MTRYLIKAPITNITSDSRLVEPGSLFLAYPGEFSDGRDYIVDAIKNGAVAVVWEEDGFSWNPKWDIKNIAIPHLKLQAGHIASQFYKKPSANMLAIGVTGTNGKTSVTHWLAQAFNHLDQAATVVGTLGNGFLNALEPTQNTTPGPIALQKMLARFVERDAKVVAMEVSSHGLDQGRVNGTEFDVAVFTNLTRDHLDYHKTMPAYEDAKRKLFAWPSLKASVINHDDLFGKQLAEELNEEFKHVLTYGIYSGEVRASNVVYHDNFFTAKITTPYGEANIKVKLIGEFNVYNTLAVLATLLVSEVSFEDAIMAISQLKPVSGRMQILGGGAQPLVVVDYAHTPDALEKVLSTLRTLTQSKLICVFGCGGDRDVGKRAEMGRVVHRMADVAVVTTDNPRSEDPKQIIQAVLAGMGTQYIVEEDRAKAISIAILSAKPDDVVLIAGKGHEDYQEIKGVKHYFSDMQEAELVLASYAEVHL